MSDTCHEIHETRRGSLHFPNSQTVKFQDEIAAFSFRDNYFLKVSETAKLSEKEFVVLDALLLPDDLWDRISERWLPALQKDMAKFEKTNRLFDLYSGVEPTLNLQTAQEAFLRLKSHANPMTQANFNGVFGPETEKTALAEFKSISQRQMSILAAYRSALFFRLTRLKEAMEVFERIFRYCADRPQDPENLKLIVDTLTYYATLTNEIQSPVTVNELDPLETPSAAEQVLGRIFENSVSLMLQGQPLKSA